MALSAETDPTLGKNAADLVIRQKKAVNLGPAPKKEDRPTTNQGKADQTTGTKTSDRTMISKKSVHPTTLERGVDPIAGKKTADSTMASKKSAHPTTFKGRVDPVRGKKAVDPVTKPKKAVDLAASAPKRVANRQEDPRGPPPGPLAWASGGSKRPPERSNSSNPTKASRGTIGPFDATQEGPSARTAGIKTVVHLGANAAARGLLAPIFTASDYRIVFVDEDRTFVDRCNHSNTYVVSELAAGFAADHKTVRNYRAYGPSRDQMPQIMEEIKAAAFVTCSVERHQLDDYAQLIAICIAEGSFHRDRKLGVISCRCSTNDARYPLRYLVETKADRLSHHSLHERWFCVDSFIDILISSQQNPASLNIAVEKRGRWCINRQDFPHQAPPFVGANATLPFSSALVVYEKITAIGRTLIAYFGHHAGLPQIADAAQDPDTRQSVQAALHEISPLIVFDTGYDADHIQRCINEVFERSANSALHHTTSLVGRHPITTLRTHLLQTASHLQLGELPYGNLLQGIKMALRFQAVGVGGLGDESNILCHLMISQPPWRIASDIAGGTNLHPQLYQRFFQIVKEIKLETVNSITLEAPQA